MSEARLPVVIVSAVVRSTHQGESHGGIYLVDFETGEYRQAIDWNTGDIDWGGRGGDRGLRGIAFHGDETYIAASDEVFVFDRRLNVVRSFRNRYLKLCHEIDIRNGRLYLSSTGFDSILVYDLASRRFIEGHCIKLDRSPSPNAEGVHEQRIGFAPFDPESTIGPPPGDTAHLNNVVAGDGVFFASGLSLDRMLVVQDRRLGFHARLPRSTHNARPFRGGVLANVTGADAIALFNRDGQILAQWPVPRYDPATLLHNDLPEDHARQGFGRGLCLLGDMLVGGSSPATVSFYSINPPTLLKSVTITLDVRNAVHGLEIWPFGRWDVD